MFSANLRLPDSLSQKEKRHRVEETIQELGLTSCANTSVSNILQYIVLSAKIIVKLTAYSSLSSCISSLLFKSMISCKSYN